MKDTGHEVMSYLQFTKEINITHSYGFSRWPGKMHKVKQFVKSKSLSSNFCLDFNKQGIVISQKFSKYEGIQVLIDDSRWLNVEFSSLTLRCGVRLTDICR